MTGQASKLVGKSLDLLRRTIDKVAWSQSNVLITGESGTGKEVVAREIHDRSPRRTHHFVAENCSAISPELFESAVFGHVKGAYTGADKTTKGLFARADEGTLFLDEVGDLPLIHQAKLLRAIDDKQITAVGSDVPRKVDVRVLAATNKNLPDMVSRGRFREDLWYRLNVVEIVVPPLCVRRGDIPELVEHFLAELNRRDDRSLSVTSDALDWIQKQPWKGNIRELKNAIERATVLGLGDELDVRSFAPADQRTLGATEVVARPESRDPNASSERHAGVDDYLAGLEDEGTTSLESRACAGVLAQRISAALAERHRRAASPEEHVQASKSAMEGLEIPECWPRELIAHSLAAVVLWDLHEHHAVDVPTKQALKTIYSSSFGKKKGELPPVLASVLDLLDL